MIILYLTNTTQND